VGILDDGFAIEIQVPGFETLNVVAKDNPRQEVRDALNKWMDKVAQLYDLDQATAAITKEPTLTPAPNQPRKR
jgi:hypothetical protein